jgi:hypothetical protein
MSSRWKGSGGARFRCVHKGSLPPLGGRTSTRISTSSRVPYHYANIIFYQINTSLWSAWGVVIREENNRPAHSVWFFANTLDCEPD